MHLGSQIKNGKENDVDSGENFSGFLVDSPETRMRHNGFGNSAVAERGKMEKNRGKIISGFLTS